MQLLVDPGAGTVIAVPVVAVPTGSAGVVVPTQGGSTPPPDKPEFGKASPVALVVILLLGIVTVLLIVNMTKRIKRLPASFDDPPVEADGAPGPAGGTDGEQAEGPASAASADQAAPSTSGTATPSTATPSTATSGTATPGTAKNGAKDSAAGS